MIVKTIKKGRGKICICKCDWCGKEFNRSGSWASRTKKHFCNVGCRTKYQIGKDLPKETREKIGKAHKGLHAGKKNPMYGKKGEDNPNYGMKRSKECRKKISENNRRRTVTEETKKKIRDALVGRKLSSETIKKISGKNHSNWQGGVPKHIEALRLSKTYRNWRTKVFKRDNHICQICGANEDLVAHHISNFTRHPKLRFEVDNGIALCRSCHTKLHRNKERELICI